MPMRPECITEVEKAIGRPLKKDEAKAIEDKISFHVRDLFRTDPARANSMTEQQRQLAGAEAAMADHLAAVEKAAQRKALNIAAQVRETAKLEARAAVLGGKQPFHSAAFERLRQLDGLIKGERNRAFASIMDVIKATEPKFLGMLRNRAAEADFVHEVFGRATGNEVAARAAKVWREQIDALRERLNAAGAAIGRLDYGWLPQPHDLRKILKTGHDSWAAYVLPRLDRRRYLNDNGTQMNDAQVMEFLDAAYETLSTDGLNKMTPGVASGKGSRAAKHDSAHRQIHFRDSDAYLEYMDAFGPTSVFEAMKSSVFGQVKDAVLIEQFGPNSAQTYRLLHDTVKQKDGAGGGLLFGSEFGATLDMVWNTVNGSLGVPANARFADFNQNLRNFLVAAKLQFTFINSVFGDLATLRQAAAYHGVSTLKPMVNILRSLSAEYRNETARFGLATESFISDLAGLSASHLSQNWSSHLADATMRITLLEGWTNAARRAISVEIMAKMAERTRGDWASLEPRHRDGMERFGVTEADWQVWRAATPEDWRGQKMLTPESVAALDSFSQRQKNDAIGKLLGYIQEESEYGAINPGLMTRATMRQGTQSGTLGGEALRNVSLFKSFGVAIFERHYRRLQRIGEVEGRAAKYHYAATLAASMAVAGALTIQLNAVMNGRDPQDMTEGKFWIQALLRSGGLGIFADAVNTGLGGESLGGQANWTGLLGPVVGTVADPMAALGSALGDVLFDGKAFDGAAHDLGGKLVKTAWNNTPFLRSWYTKAAIEHIFVHNFQELLSPGYLRRMERRAKKEFNQSFWWEPGEKLPGRAPNLGAAVGGR